VVHDMQTEQAGETTAAATASSARSESGQRTTSVKKRRWPKIVIWTVAVALLAASGAMLYAYMSVKQAADRMYQPLPTDQPKYVSRDPDVQQRQQAQAATSTATSAKSADEALPAFTALLLGVDQRPGDRGRSDSIMVVTVNPNSGKALLYNIPRDTRTRLVKRGYDDKINHAYAYDGIAGSVATVENFIDLPIDYYVQVNMEGFETLVDLLNGVDVVNPFAFDYEGRSFPEGPLHLDGELALKYSRMRFDDPRGDFGRNERQRQVLKDMFRRAGQWDGIASFQDVLQTMSEHIRTNLTFRQMQNLFLKYRTKITTIDSTEVRGSSARIDGIYYYLVDEAERTRLHDAMKAELLEGDERR